MDQKLEELETRLAFQDQEISVLNNVIIDQQKQIDLLSDKIRMLDDKMKDMKSPQLMPESEEPPPPHY